MLRAKLKAQEQDIEALSQKLSHKERDVSKTDDSFKELREDLSKETRLRAQAQAAAEKFKKLLDEKVPQVAFVCCIYCRSLHLEGIRAGGG